MKAKIWYGKILFLALTHTIHGQCFLDSLSLTLIDCDSQAVRLVIDLRASEVASDSFYLIVNKDLVGKFAYANLPLEIPKISTQTQDRLQLDVQDVLSDSCSISEELILPACQTRSCLDNELKLSVVDSCSGNELYYIKVEHAGDRDDSLSIYFDGIWWTTLTTGQLPQIFPVMTMNPWICVLIKSIRDFGCVLEATFQVPDCKMNCGISDLSLKQVECRDQFYYLEVDFDHFGEHSTRFELTINEELRGEYKYDELPLWIGPLNYEVNGFPIVRVNDIENKNCFLISKVDSIPCISNCDLGDLMIEIDSCDSGLFQAIIQFEYSGDSRDSFGIKGNGNYYGTYAYTDFPVTLRDLWADKVRPYEFVVFSIKNTTCRKDFFLGIVDCRCDFPDLTLETGDCTSDSTYVLELDFRSELTSQYKLYARDKVLFEFSGADLPLRIEKFPLLAGEEQLAQLCSVQDSICCRYLQWSRPGCFIDTCSISEVLIQSTSCEDNHFYLKVDFQVSGSTSDYFIIKSNGEFIGNYRYDQLPVKLGPFIADDAPDVLEICDAEDHTCHVLVEVPSSDCPCRDLGVKVKTGGCTSDSTYQIIMDADISSSFDFYVNGHFFGSFEGSRLPDTLFDFPASGKNYDYIKVCPLDSNYCCTEKKIESPLCIRKPCTLPLRFEISSCDNDDFFEVKLLSDTSQLLPVNIAVKWEDHFWEFNTEDQSEFQIGPFKSGDSFYKLKVWDLDNPDCADFIEVGRIVCPYRCDISIPSIRWDSCVQGQTKRIVIDSIISDFKTFDISLDDEYIGFFKKDNLPWYLEIGNSERDSILLRICISDNTTCCLQMNWPVIPCESEEPDCIAIEFRIDTISCKNDSLWFDLAINSPAVPGRYFLSWNGKQISEFDLDELPLHIGPIPSSRETSEILIGSLTQTQCIYEYDLYQYACPARSLSNGFVNLIIQSDEYTGLIRVPDIVHTRAYMQMVDIQGRLIYNLNFSSTSPQVILDVPGLTSGFYFIKIRDFEGNSFVGKLVIP